jgi:ABC-type amino acid transport substrate-binding protein
MKHLITAAVLTAAAVAAATPVFAQESAPGPGKVVITVIPGGATFFTDAEDNPNSGSFGNYELGGGVAVNLSRYVGVEGEVSGGIGVSQTIELGSSTFDGRSPNLLNYSGNLVISAPNRTSVVPYVTGGVGGLTMFERTGLTVNDSETFLTGNVGGGVAWYAGRWGLRGDYRFIAVQSKDDASSFFGQEERYGHRVYAGLLLNVGR